LETMSTSTQHRTGAALAAFEKLDSRMRQWALDEGGREHSFPVLIAAETLRRAEYPDAFPHLLMAPAVAADPGQPFAQGNTALADWFLSPAVCYHAYAQFAGRTLDGGEMLTARGHCFRNEDAAALTPGRRQIEFEMRELILIGAPEWIEQRLGVLKAGVEALARAAGVNAEWQVASDPFFLPRARGKAHIQRLLGTKIELCLPDGLAIASINRHAAFFGERFDIHMSDGRAAHSACVAFGLDRWAAHAAQPTPTL
jgi:seryl-tRNA synthetase